MASPPGAGGSRYVGRVVDPDVRDDGETEPEVELNPSSSAAPMGARGPERPPERPRASALEDGSAVGGEPEPQAAPEAAGAPSAVPGEPGSQPHAARGADMRARLLAKARAAEQARDGGPPELLAELETIGRTTESRADEVEDFVAPPPPTGRAPSAPFTPTTPRELSPNLVALFSTLVGIAAIASITALFMSLEARLPIPKAVRPVAAPASSASPIAQAPAEPKAKPKRQRQKIPGPWRLADAKGDGKYRLIEGKVGTSSFLKALEAAGAPEAQGYRVLAAMRGIVDLDKCKKTDRFQALLERGTSKLYALEYLTGTEDVYQAKEVEGRLTGAKLDLKIERAQVTGALSYDGSGFDKSAETAGFDPGLAKVVARALDGHMVLDELDRGDVLKVVAQEVTVLGEFSRYAGIEALELIRGDPKKTHLRIYYSDAPGIRGYYDHDGRAPFEGGWRKPIKDAPRTSPFNPKRMHPVLKKVMPHNGTDFGAPTGTPVGASSFGTVSFIGNGGPAGNLVKIMHPGGVETGYAHLSRFASGLKLGDKVKRMQIIGYVGNTGRSTGPHLHFSAARDGVFFDAETLNLDGMRTLTPSEREAFKAITVKYDPMLDGIPMPERYVPIPVATPEPAPSTAPPVRVSGAPAPDDDAAEESEDASTAAATVAAPGAVPAPPSPSRPGGSAVYLSDKELLEAQSATDDGEVEE